MVVPLLVVAGAVGASMVWPKTYTATASVVVDAKPDPVAAAFSPNMASPVFMATQVDILQSQRVAQRVVRNLKLADNPQIRAQWQEATKGQINVEEWLGQTFENSMVVKPSRESNVIEVTYKSPDPRFAAGLANAFVQAYIDTSLEMRTNPAKQYSSFFDSRVKEARDLLESSQAKLTAFQKQHGLLATDERLDIENQRLIELMSQNVALGAVAAESVSRQAQARGKEADMLQDVLANPVIANLKSETSRLEASLQALNSRLGDKHPQVVEARANLAELRARIEAETRKVTGGVGVTNNINQSRHGQVRAELDAQRAKVLRLKNLRDEAQVLQRDVESAQRSYDALQARLTQTTLESQSNQTNLYPLTLASVPIEPSSPRMILNAVVSLFAGVLLAILLALGLELRDRRVREPDDVLQALGLPVLGALPRPNAKRYSAGVRSIALTRMHSLAAPDNYGQGQGA